MLAVDEAAAVHVTRTEATMPCHPRITPYARSHPNSVHLPFPAYQRCSALGSCELLKAITNRLCSFADSSLLSLRSAWALPAWTGGCSCKRNFAALRF